jgi:nitronate monooxygenase
VSRDWIDGWAVGDPERANTFVGEAVGLIDTIDPAAVLIERMGAQGASILGRD